MKGGEARDSEVKMRCAGKWREKEKEEQRKREDVGSYLFVALSELC